MAAAHEEQSTFAELKALWERDGADLTAQLARAEDQLTDARSKEEGLRRAHQREAEDFAEKLEAAQAQAKELQRQVFSKQPTE